MISNQMFSAFSKFVNLGYALKVFPFKLISSPVWEFQMGNLHQIILSLLINVLSIPGQLAFQSGLIFELFFWELDAHFVAFGLGLLLISFHVTMTQFFCIVNLKSVLMLYNTTFAHNSNQGKLNFLNFFFCIIFHANINVKVLIFLGTH